MPTTTCQTKDSDILLTKPEVAKILRVTPRSVEKYMKERRLRFIKLGHSVRFERSSVDDLKRQFTVEAIG